MKLNWKKIKKVFWPVVLAIAYLSQVYGILIDGELYHHGRKWGNIWGNSAIIFAFIFSIGMFHAIIIAVQELRKKEEDNGKENNEANLEKN